MMAEILTCGRMVEKHNALTCISWEMMIMIALREIKLQEVLERQRLGLMKR